MLGLVVAAAASAARDNRAHSAQHTPRERLASLFHPATRQAAAEHDARCSHVIYTSYSSASVHPHLEAPAAIESPEGTCFVLFIEFVASRPAESVPPGWHVIAHRRRSQTSSMSARRFSRLPKLLPHVLFPRATTLYKDTKLLLHRTAPARLFGHLRRTGAAFVAFMHPHRCSAHLQPHWTPNSSAACNATGWMLAEAAMVEKDGRVESAAVLRQQVRSHAHEVRASGPYIDGAVLVQRGAGALFDAWADEYFAPAASDRDQIAFAYAWGRVPQATAAAFLPYGEGCKKDAQRLCHWYLGPWVASLRRHNFDRRTRSDDAPSLRAPSGIQSPRLTV